MHNYMQKHHFFISLWHRYVTVWTPLRNGVDRNGVDI